MATGAQATAGLSELMTWARVGAEPKLRDDDRADILAAYGATLLVDACWAFVASAPSEPKATVPWVGRDSPASRGQSAVRRPTTHSLAPLRSGEDSDKPRVEVSPGLSEHLLESVLGREGDATRCRFGQLHVGISDSQDAREYGDLLTGKAHREAADRCRDSWNQLVPESSRSCATGRALTSTTSDLGSVPAQATTATFPDSGL